MFYYRNLNHGGTMTLKKHCALLLSQTVTVVQNSYGTSIKSLLRNSAVKRLAFPIHFIFQKDLVNLLPSRKARISSKEMIMPDGNHQSINRFNRIIKVHELFESLAGFQLLMVKSIRV